MATTEAPADTPTEKRLELVRGLGAWASGAIVVGTMIGTGIFLKPAEMAREGRFVSVVFAAWIAGAILSLFGALSYAELGAMIPEAGGEYAYLRRGFGPVWGFLFGWMHSIVGRPSSASSIAAGLVRFLGFLLPAVATPIFTLHIAIPGLTGWLKPYDFVFTWGLSHRDQNHFRRHRHWRRVFCAFFFPPRARSRLAGLARRRRVRRLSRSVSCRPVGL